MNTQPILSGSLASQLQALLLHITQPALGAGALGRWDTCGQMCGMACLQWPNTGLRQKGGEGSSVSVALNLHKYVALTVSSLKLATENLPISPVPPQQLEFVTRGAVGALRGGAHGAQLPRPMVSWLCQLSRGVEEHL